MGEPIVDAMLEGRRQKGDPSGPRRAPLDGVAVRRETPPWLHRHVQMLALLDALAAAAATIASKALAYGLGSAADLHVRTVHIPYAAFIVVTVPTWLAVLTKLNPLTYAVQPMRAAVFNEINLEPSVRSQLDPPITWGSWEVPMAVQLGVVAVVTVALIGIAVALFDRTE